MHLRVEPLTEHEEAIGTLYRLFSEKYPECRGVWSELADDEANHASWIRGLAARVRDGKVRLNLERFQNEAIQSSMAFVRRQTEIMNSQFLPLQNAISIALQLEETILEKRFFEVFETSDPEIEEIIQNIVAETRMHYDKLKAIHKT